MCKNEYYLHRDGPLPDEIVEAALEPLAFPFLLLRVFDNSVIIRTDASLSALKQVLHGATALAPFIVLKVKQGSTESTRYSQPPIPKTYE